MPPDLNTLPPSSTTFSSIYQPSPTNNPGENNTPQQPASPRSSISPATAATMSAADNSRRSSTSAHRFPSSASRRMSESRRSGTGLNISLNDPSPLGSGDGSSGEHHRSSISSAFRTHSPTSIGGSPTIATGDPHHHQRTPSIGEIHQELEQEQEAQVNRLLSMIRTQQSQLQQMQQSQNQPQTSSSGTAIVDDSTPTSERSWSLPSVPPLSSQAHRGPIPIASARRGSRSSNHGVSPGLIPVGSQPESTLSNNMEFGMTGGDGAGRRSSRDDGSFYQAETAMLSRENQMLKLRIRELERQVQELTTSSVPTPASRLSQSTSSADQSSQNLTMRPNTNSASQAASQQPSLDSDKP